MRQCCDHLERERGEGVDGQVGMYIDIQRVGGQMGGENNSDIQNIKLYDNIINGNQQTLEGEEEKKPY